MSSTYDDPKRRREIGAAGQRMQEACDRIIARFDRMLAMAQAILDRLEQPADVPLHQRGFGVLDEAPPP
jgi:hypothetical protein